MSVFCFLLFVFFKQNTAYEMRISDWSSDVCSSDLKRGLLIVGEPVGLEGGEREYREWRQQSQIGEIGGEHRSWNEEKQDQQQPSRKPQARIEPVAKDE